jgi:hypothetical protein
MAKKKPNYTEMTYQVVRESPDPLPFDEIMERVQTITPITTRNPKGTIRSAIGQSRMIVATGDGCYGWKPRLITGSAIRLTLSQSDLAGQAVEFGDELQDALWPSFFESQKRSDRTPVNVRLADGSTTQLPIDFLGAGHWGTRGSPEFWAWFESLGAAPGDHLLFRVLDGDAKSHSVEFQPRAARDDAAIAERNQTVVQAALAFLRSKARGAMTWDITTHLLVTGQYQHPVPPDPFAEIWTPEVWQPEMNRKTPVGGWILADQAQMAPEADELLRALFGAVARAYDYDDPPNLPPEYQPGPRRRPRPSRKASKGAVRTFTLRVNHRALPQVWRDIEIAEDQTLEDLHLAIQWAYNWDDDHLYSFFMSGQVMDRQTEIGSPWSETHQHTHEIEITSLGLKVHRKFLYYFDYGDSHEFDVQVLRIDPSAPPGKYPRIVARQGQSPPQYPDYDEETGEMSWNPYQREDE